MEDWPDNDYRLFCGNIGNEVTDEVLANAFRKYHSFLRARVNIYIRRVFDLILSLNQIFFSKGGQR